MRDFLKFLPGMAYKETWRYKKIPINLFATPFNTVESRYFERPRGQRKGYDNGFSSQYYSKMFRGLPKLPNMLRGLPKITETLNDDVQPLKTEGV